MPKRTSGRSNACGTRWSARASTNPTPGEAGRQDVHDAFVRGDVAMVNGHPTRMQPAREGGIDLAELMENAGS